MEWVTVALLIFGVVEAARRGRRLAIGALYNLLADDEPEAGTPSSAPVATLPAPSYGAYLVNQGEADDDDWLTPDEWLMLLNEQPDIVPHIAACGPSGSGKTQLVQAVLSERAGQFLITTPKPASQDRWNGFPAVRLVFDPLTAKPSYTAIGDAIEAFYNELNWRGLRDEVGEPATLVVDELTTTIAELKREGRDIVPMLIALWLRGRSAGMRLITMDPTINVKGWGLEHRGDVRENIAFIRCERGTYRAWVGELDEVRNDRRDGVELDTSTVMQLVVGSPDPGLLWLPPGQFNRPARQEIVSELGTPTSAQATPYEVTLVRGWFDEGDQKLRSLARRLYKARGGEGPYEGTGGPFYAVKAALDGVSMRQGREAL